MTKLVLTYGIIGGIIVSVGMGLGITFIPTGGTLGMAAGYLSMLIALASVFMGVKEYRDNIKGGVIRFWPALGLGLSIAGIAGLFYVAAWEAYMYATNYTFFDTYIASTIELMRASGKPAEEIAKFRTEMMAFKLQYANPLFRMLLTFTEIAPVGLLVAIVSAALLRRSEFLPAKTMYKQAKRSA
ncbi:MAG: DUF4199 domain-containing protein [Sphingorhabdus sp.]